MCTVVITRPFALLAGFFLLLLGSACSRVDAGVTPQASQRLIITGSSTIAPLMTELAAQYEKIHPLVRIDVQSGGSGRGIADVHQGVADFGMVSRALRAEENDLLRWPIARDGVAMIAHRTNSVTALSSDQVRAIYTGKIKNWAQLGGASDSITVVHKASGRATLEVFLEYFDLRNPDVMAAIIAGENEQAIKTVMADARALAYVSIGTAEADIQNGVAIQLLKLDGIDATTATVADGTYPMARPLQVVAMQEPQGVAADFLAYIRSADVADLIRAQSFTPLLP